MGCEPREPGWHRNPDALRDEYEAHGTFQGIANTHGGSETTYSKAWRTHGLPPIPRGAKPAGTTGSNVVRTDADVTVDVDRLDDIHAELRSRGLDPAEWVVVRVTVNTWDGMTKVDEDVQTVPLRQLKVVLRPNLGTLLRPAVTEGKARLVKPLTKQRGGNHVSPRLVVFVGDEQAPYHDERLHGLFLEWLAVNKPDEGVHLGDLMDLPTLSRHRANPQWNASPQECVNAAYRILRGYRDASPDTSWRALPGNHDERLRDYTLQRAAELYGVRAADIEDELAPALSLRTLLHLDALGVEWLGGHGDYEHAQADITQTLVARHGWITGGNSAEKTVKRLGLNVVVGHTHRQRVHYVTEERMRESLTMVCIEAGAMCTVEGGLGYTVNPDWQNGAYAANVWPDGSFSGDHLQYRDGVLCWRDQRYSV